MFRSQKYKMSFGAAIAGTVLLAATGCTPGDAAPPTAEKASIKIGVSFDHLNAVRQAELEGIEEAAKESGSTVVQQTSNSDAATQASQIQTMIDSGGVDAIIATPVNFDQIGASIAYATSKNIPFIVMDKSASDTSMIAYQITGDPVADGKLAGEALTKSGDPEKVIELVGNLTDNNAIGRRDGFSEAIEGSKVELVQQVPTEWDTTKALNGLTNALQSNPDVTAIYTPSDYLLPSVVSALKGIDRYVPAGENGHVKIVSIDGDPTGCQMLKDGFVDTIIVTKLQEFGPAAVDAAIKAVNGETIDQKTEEIAGLVASHEDVASLESQIWGCNAK